MSQYYLFFKMTLFVVPVCGFKFILWVCTKNTDSILSQPSHTHIHMASHMLLPTFACSNESFDSGVTALYPVCIWRPVIKTLDLKTVVCVCFPSKLERKHCHISNENNYITQLLDLAEYGAQTSRVAP